MSKALFEVWSVNLDKLEDGQIELLVARRRQLMREFARLMDDNEFMSADFLHGTGDSQTSKLYRFNKIEDIIQETLSD